MGNFTCFSSFSQCSVVHLPVRVYIHFDYIVISFIEWNANDLLQVTVTFEIFKQPHKNHTENNSTYDTNYELDDKEQKEQIK